MIGRIGSTPVNFHGKFIQNKIFNEAIDLTKTEILEQTFMYNANEFIDALEFISNHTPDTDVFELRKGKRTSENTVPVILYRNDKPVRMNSSYNYSPVTVCNLVKGYVSDIDRFGSYKENPSITLIRQAEKKKQDIDKAYAPKFDELRNKYYVECDKLSDQKAKEKESLDKEVENLRNKLSRESMQRLNNIEEEIAAEK